MGNFYQIKIGPENIINKIFPVIYSGGTYSQLIPGDVCCTTGDTIVKGTITGTTFVYSSMTQILSGGTNGNSILTGLTIPVVLDQYATDVGYFSTFDGGIQQKDTMLNFIFLPDTGNTHTLHFYNTSGNELKQYLQFSTYTIDWGDGTLFEQVNSSIPFYYTHTYATNGSFTISMSGQSPWGINIVQKKVYVPFLDCGDQEIIDNPNLALNCKKILIDNPEGEAYFIPQGGQWSATPISYKYIFSGDSGTNVEDYYSSNYTQIPITITGYTKSSLNDLVVYGNKNDLIDGKFTTGIIPLSEGQGEYVGVGPDNLYTAYTINNVSYFNYSDSTTLFIVESSGFTSDWLVLSALTKNEALMNIIDEPEVQSNVFIERGKNSGVESVVRLGEVDTIDELVRYGYKFFKINNNNN
mgnify:CR=1 FL=1